MEAPMYIPDEMIDERSWKEFRDAGMLWVANTVLQMFGWSLTAECGGEDYREVIDMYPVRTKFRGFGEEQVSDGNSRLMKYISANLYDLVNEANL